MTDLVEHQQEPTPADLPVIGTSSAALILDEKSMARMEAIADMMASGRSTVPAHLQKSKGDCMAVVMQAMSWGMNPWAVAQKTHLVNGQLGYEGQLVNAVISTSRALRGRPEYEWYGPWEKVIGKFTIKTKKGEPGKKDTEYRVPGWSMEDEKGCGIRIWATLKGEDEPRYLELLLEQASVRNSPLWASDPKQQLAYLAVKRWSRLYCPDIILGVNTPDELAEAAPMKDINEPLPKNAKPADFANRKRNAESTAPTQTLLTKARDAADQGRDAFANFWRGIQPKDRGALRDELEDLQARVNTVENSKPIDQDMRESPPPPSPAPAAPPAGTGTAAVDDDFVQAMDRASGVIDDSDYVGGHVPE